MSSFFCPTFWILLTFPKFIYLRAADILAVLNTPEHTSQLLSENVLQNQNLPCCKHGKMIHIVQVFLTHSKLWKNVGDAQNIHLDVLFWNTNGSEVCLLTAWSSFLASYSSVKIKGRDFYSCQTEVVLLLLHWSDSPWLSANTEGGGSSV